MNKINFFGPKYLFVLILFLPLIAFSQNYNLNLSKSKIKWTGKKILGSHWGYVNFKSGQIQVSSDKITGGSFEVDMNTIQNVDLKDQSLNQKLVGHLKSDDFFGVQTYPTAQFVITHVTQIKDAKANQPNYAITGKMTIKGKTQTIAFPAWIKFDKNTIRAKANFDIDRSKFDIKYGSGSFFDNLGDNLIYDNFTLELDLEFNRM